MALPLLATLGVAVTIFAGVMFLDRNRIRNYIAARGGTVLSLSWNPLGPGWFGEKDSNIYRVRYRDADGAVREARCKTGLFSGVYFTQDIVVNRGRKPDGRTAAPRDAAGRSPSYEDLLAENRRLKEEVSMLREESRR